MRSAEEIYIDILANPGSDELREEFAKSVSATEPRWTSYIERSLSNFDARSRPDVAIYPDLGPFRGVNSPPSSIARRIAATYEAFHDVVVNYSRGFPGWLTCAPRALLDHGEELLANAPIVSVLLSGNKVPKREFDAQVKELASCPSLARLYQLRIINGAVSTETFVAFTNSPYIERLLVFELPTLDDEPAKIEESWGALLASPACRRMIDWGRYTRVDVNPNWDWKTTITAPGEFGDVQLETVNGDMRITTSYQPMNAESRALEQRYGYIPALHAINWHAGPLDVLQGRKPNFPAGAIPTEKMYAVPAPYAERSPGW